MLVCLVVHAPSTPTTVVFFTHSIRLRYRVDGLARLDFVTPQYAAPCPQRLEKSGIGRKGVQADRAWLRDAQRLLLSAPLSLPLAEAYLARALLHPELLVYASRLSRRRTGPAAHACVDRAHDVRLGAVVPLLRVLGTSNLQCDLQAPGHQQVRMSRPTVEMSVACSGYYEHRKMVAVVAGGLPLSDLLWHITAAVDGFIAVRVVLTPSACYYLSLGAWKTRSVPAACTPPQFAAGGAGGVRP
ncbi:hypothetical protein FA95DRAFT_1606287 [Auriscalpium vulgare]|uniref:Uncharacterized protein n=1 Tax=Auriscalpium vulgare TaxID=40419 RepID=A0ACB8RTF4_9AGAM|nr:hypothetical protein FA95DRAFT_1606287 [Auriscalpium vulgare]